LTYALIDIYVYAELTFMMNEYLTYKMLKKYILDIHDANLLNYFISFSFCKTFSSFLTLTAHLLYCIMK